MSVIESLQLMLKARDTATYYHSQRVAQLACVIAEAMGFKAHSLQTLRRAALLHDLGKVAVPDAILLKQAPLNKAELEIVKTHPTAAAQILAPLAFLQEEIVIIEQHHEHVDGGGYPRGLCGAQLHPLTKVLAVADAYEAMTADRPYRKALPPTQAVKQLWRGRGSQFDAAVVDVCLELAQRKTTFGRTCEAELFKRTGEAACLVSETFP
ncbi:MAG TPA: hypothetical protein DCE00_05670 [Firmicutes bacterium]|mgnify:CR=1 FL=1|nr:HD domain-containing protein [Bacillota bacterium]HAA38342.1 hypothetical protein [Bacillota bacterium]